MKRYLTASQLRERHGGMSDMSLWRRLQDKNLNFPRPLVINRRRLFDEDEIIAWENAQREKAA